MTTARITDEMVEKTRARIGKEIPQRELPYHTEATRDNIRHFAQGVGDDSPLWLDQEYGRKTRWGTILAPPVFLDTRSDGEWRGSSSRRTSAEGASPVLVGSGRVC